MHRIVLAGLVALAAACGDERKEQRPIQYGTPEAPALEEQGAADTAQTTLQGSLAFTPITPTVEPASGAPGLADQLVASLGGYAAAKAAPAARSRKLAASATTRAIDTGGIDPSCVATTETSVTWSGCTATLTETDPYTGETMTMTVTVAGTLTRNAATGVTTWNIHETLGMTGTQAGEAVTMDATVDLSGTVTATASTIAGDTASSAIVRATYMGIPVNEAVRTTLALELGYQAEPFCLTSGTLVLEQRWAERPMGATEADLPDRGWRFEWTGCDQFTVAHGS